MGEIISDYCRNTFMSLIFNAQAFNRLRPLSGTGFPLPRREKLRPPAGKLDNPVAQLVRFAAAMGLTELSAKTVHALRDHPYYRYAFYGIFRHADIISDNTFFAENDRPRFIALLRDPDLLNDEDIYHGILNYTNNFCGYLPGGLYRTQRGMVQNQPVLKAIERALRQLGKTESEILSLKHEMDMERCDPVDYSKRAAFMKMAVEVFHLVVKEGFDPAELWH